jgi:hypothetical protein
MDGWQVMAAPLSAVVRVGLVATVAATVTVWWGRLVDGPRRASAPERRPGAVTDAAIVAAYNDALSDGWPPGELLTFIEAGRRAGTSGEHVRSVIARHWAT